MSVIDAAEQSLEPNAGSVRAARRAVEQAIEGIVGDGAREGLLLATSEVVTNAVEHGEPPIELVIERHPGRVRVAVRDGSPLVPHRGEPTPSDVRGRGMVIVERCTSRWGVEHGAHGKAVWFEVDL
jgi:anti-sigma regulatory factor (Ser/Thr protein kinase)